MSPFKRAFCTVLIALGAPIFGEETVVSLDELLTMFNWNLETAEITTQKVDDGLYVLFGPGGNVAVSIGEQGVLVVDDMFPEVIPKVNKAIEELGGGAIDFAINTHWHFDHAQGNLALGPAGSWIVAHEYSTQMMAKDNIVNLIRVKMMQEAYPPVARPVISFQDSMTFHFNGKRIDLVHRARAHTGGDAVVIFRDQNAVHFGDVYVNTGYPFIDFDSGGSIDGMIRFCESVLAELNEDTTVIPGHGAIAEVTDLRDYLDMLKTVRMRVAGMIDEGKSLQEVEAAQPTADFDEQFGPVANSLGFVNRVYSSLKAGY